MFIRKDNGFTIVETIIVVVIIGMLSSLAIISYDQFTLSARDGIRQSRAVSLQSALEKYYSRYGEYPGCTAITKDASIVSRSVLVGISKEILLAPNAAAGVNNSIVCASVTTTSQIGYVGDGTATCSTGAACTSYTLQYKKEADGTVASISSQHH